MKCFLKSNLCLPDRHNYFDLVLYVLHFFPQPALFKHSELVPDLCNRSGTNSVGALIYYIDFTC